jgi:hypothetical protein
VCPPGRLPAALVARDNPPTGDNQPWVDRQVAERSDRSVAELLDEGDAVGPAFEGLMGKLPHAFGGLVYDAVAHEHDLRGALGRPGDRDSAGVLAGLDVTIAVVERDLAANGPGRARCGSGPASGNGSSEGATRRCRSPPRRSS